MSQYNRESGTGGRNQFGITESDLCDVREQNAKLLTIECKLGAKNRHYALVKNFPGLDAEMSEYELRKMAEQLIKTADALSTENK